MEETEDPGAVAAAQALGQLQTQEEQALRVQMEETQQGGETLAAEVAQALLVETQTLIPRPAMVEAAPRQALRAPASPGLAAVVAAYITRQLAVAQEAEAADRPRHALSVALALQIQGEVVPAAAVQTLLPLCVMPAETAAPALSS